MGKTVFRYFFDFMDGKLRWRPYGKGWGQIATSPGTFNKELLILEKKRERLIRNLMG
ncbi:hypothetical protein [Paenibacillus sanguinis]|uniref:hypothetical protein n=1 Tax=Paenibacillus sanguinis TaxID=225906 RepID=UPI00036E62E5|nr:hypothetical protein [Paenibacillus sanguinis]